MKTKKTDQTKEQIKKMLFQLGANLTGMIDKQKLKEQYEKDPNQKEMYKTQQLVFESQKSMVDIIYKLVDGEFYKKSK
jgi:hypothetical protein